MADGSCPLLVLNPQSEIRIDFIGAFAAFEYYSFFAAQTIYLSFTHTFIEKNMSAELKQKLQEIQQRLLALKEHL